MGYVLSLQLLTYAERASVRVENHIMTPNPKKNCMVARREATALSIPIPPTRPQFASNSTVTSSSLTHSALGSTQAKPFSPQEYSAFWHYARSRTKSAVGGGGCFTSVRSADASPRQDQRGACESQVLTVGAFPFLCLLYCRVGSSPINPPVPLDETSNFRGFPLPFLFLLSSFPAM